MIPNRLLSGTKAQQALQPKHWALASTRVTTAAQLWYSGCTPKPKPKMTKSPCLTWSGHILGAVSLLMLIPNHGHQLPSQNGSISNFRGGLRGKSSPNFETMEMFTRRMHWPVAKLGGLEQNRNHMDSFKADQLWVFPCSEKASALFH